MPGPERVRVKDNREKIRKALITGAEKGVGDAVHRIVEHAKQRAPVKDGTLQRMISAGPVRRKKDTVSASFGAYAPHSAAVEYGTAGRGEPVGRVYTSPVGRSGDWPLTPPGKKRFGPYTIEPIPPRKYLRWEGADGKEHFAKKVRHPGVAPQPYMRPAVDIVRHREGGPIIGRRIQAELRGALG